jgi:hypothetical protein
MCCPTIPKSAALRQGDSASLRDGTQAGRESARVAAHQGLWSSRRVRALVLAQAAVRLRSR